MAFQGFLERFGAGKRQAWTPRKSHGCGLLPALEAHKKLLKWPFRGFRGLERFRAGKRQAWTPIKSRGCGLLPALEAHKKPLKWPFRGFWSVLGLANGKLGRP